MEEDGEGGREEQELQQLHFLVEVEELKGQV